ncbi:hypothetical protein N8146_10020 [Ascidiaceihabitans sp.]|nr:hypothetical protein [Ascidiaceihabitans sp.]
MKDNFNVMAVRLNRNKAVSVVLTIRFVIDRNAVTVGGARQTEFACVDDVVIDVDCTVTLRSADPRSTWPTLTSPVTKSLLSVA